LEVIVRSRTKEALLNVVRNRRSSPRQVRNATAWLHAEEQDDFTEVMVILFEHHPAIAEEFAAVIPERLIPKTSDWAV
jgi:hypothetical protein